MSLLNFRYSSSTVVVVVALILTLLALWGELSLPHFWNDRLWLPAHQEEVDRHTPRYTAGTVLPAVITENLTISPADNPVLVLGTTSISPGTTVTLQAGTQLYAAEFAAVHVGGTLRATGTQAAPIILTTNELHPDNQLWGGVVFTDNSRGELTHIRLSFAAPGVSCLNGSTVRVEQAQIERSPLGVYSETTDCALHDSELNAVRTGVVGPANLLDRWSATTIRAWVREQVTIPAP